MSRDRLDIAPFFFQTTINLFRSGEQPPTNPAHQRSVELPERCSPQPASNRSVPRHSRRVGSAHRPSLMRWPCPRRENSEKLARYEEGKKIPVGGKPPLSTQPAPTDVDGISRVYFQSTSRLPLLNPVPLRLPRLAGQRSCRSTGDRPPAKLGRECLRGWRSASARWWC